MSQPSVARPPLATVNVARPNLGGLRRFALGAAPVVALVLIWQSLTFNADPRASLFVVSPSMVGHRFAELIASGELLRNTASSLWRLLFGFLIGAALGIPLGIYIGWVPLVRHIAKPLVEFIRPVPIPAWVPLFVLLFGIGWKPAVFLIALSSFLPIVVSTWDAVRHTNPTHVRVAQCLGASRFEILTRVVLPSALPGIFTGLRIAMGISVMVVVLAELMAVRSGLGYMIETAQTEFDMSTIIVGIISTALLGYALGAGMNSIAARVMPWHK